MKLFKRVALAFKSRAEKVDRQLPSVDSFDTKLELEYALEAAPDSVEGSTAEESLNRRGSVNSQGSSYSEQQKKRRCKKAPVGWKLVTYDKDASRPQTMEEEFKRLKVLQSYFVLDSEEEEDFNRITNFAASLFDVPFAFISVSSPCRSTKMARLTYFQPITVGRLGSPVVSFEIWIGCC